jgi:hypothetical protein
MVSQRGTPITTIILASIFCVLVVGIVAYICMNPRRKPAQKARILREKRARLQEQPASLQELGGIASNGVEPNEGEATNVAITTDEVLATGAMTV